MRSGSSTRSWADPALGEPARGDDLVARLEARLSALHAETSAMPRRPSIACIEWIDPLMPCSRRGRRL